MRIQCKNCTKAITVKRNTTYCSKECKDLAFGNLKYWQGKTRDAATRSKIKAKRALQVITKETKSKISASMTGRALSQEHKDKIGRSLLRERSIEWKGERAAYSAKHKWITRHMGNPQKCVDCGLIGAKVRGRWNIEWSNKDHKYSRNHENYAGRCAKCHLTFDRMMP